ncbi:hypothetical protein ILUMI_10931 [Ignelater luminosus]|uniref:Uncharacterized protein n=1 Tax=Ignelater luminosus TaxID=2038154 RepID=A0A8K0G877_IGNLU|nr:hypothetical protein ILUMI_10931 [Ignelater luminosus]
MTVTSAALSAESSSHPKILKLDVKTRWNNVLTMMESIDRINKNLINVILQKTGRRDLELFALEWEIFKDLLGFLSKFKQITEIPSKQKVSTLNLVLVFRSELFSILKADPKDTTAIKTMKASMLRNFKHRFPITEIEVLVSLLDSRFQNLTDGCNYLSSKKNECYQVFGKACSKRN